MNWLLTAILCFILIECVVRIPFPEVFSEINRVARKAMHVLGARAVSDHWKEKALLAYAGSLFAATMKLAALLAAVGTAALLLIYVFDYFGGRVGEFITSWTGIIFSIAVASAYIPLRKFLV